MSDTKGLNNLRDLAKGQIAHLEAENRRLDKEVETERGERRRFQADANHYRAEARRLDDALEQLGDALRAQLAVAVQASEDNPGQAVLAAAVRQARKAYSAWETTKEEGRG
jgi:hypothetical protein